MKTKQELVSTIRDFVTQIGIENRDATLPDDTFLPGLLIDQGKLFIDSEKLLYPGDILHEAGHIAVTLPDQRPFLSGNIIDNSPEKMGDEIAVLLWTYAACLHIGIAPEVVFHPAGYKGDSEWLIDQFTSRNYMGLPLLVWMGLADDVSINSPNSFPTMKMWLREN
ncbi:hypothetical protein [Spirosoma litoris]